MLLSDRRQAVANPNIPSTLLTILESFRGCFTRPSFANFVALVTGWILCQGRHSISRIVQATGLCPKVCDHSVFYRFFSRARWNPDSLGQVLFQLLLPLLSERVIAIVDDTLAAKSGPHIFGAGIRRQFAAGRRDHPAVPLCQPGAADLPTIGVRDY